ncbi:hypothetical protein [Caenimonas soli]|uniref:hypothetical protein n=1 Tax=Caenimonas soli TaxID=2735555 RepID=UPI0015558662|nr:hypothetical protein [Caenimonas soli]NPC58726.1 hypothetical protein [Caenimonas soli]
MSLQPESSRLVFRTALRSRANSYANRRRAKDLAWRWVGTKWPQLIPSASELESSALERRCPGQRLLLTTNADGSAWMLEVAYSEKNSRRTWTTRATVTDTGEADLMTLQTACSNLDSAPAVIAPPKLLGAWVERLDLEDGGVAVVGEPRMVGDPMQLDAFCDHVLLDQRALPVIALTNKANSHYYGVDPRGLSEAVRGVAHVVCLTPELAADASQRLGKNLVPVPGAPRIYGMHFSPAASPKDHPVIRPPVVAKAQDPGALRRLLCQRVCAISVSP